MKINGSNEKWRADTLVAALGMGQIKLGMLSKADLTTLLRDDRLDETQLGLIKNELRKKERSERTARKRASRSSQRQRPLPRLIRV